MMFVFVTILCATAKHKRLLSSPGQDNSRCQVHLGLILLRFEGERIAREDLIRLDWT